MLQSQLQNSIYHTGTSSKKHVYLCLWEIGKTVTLKVKLLRYGSAYFRRETLRKTLGYCFSMIPLSTSFAPQVVLSFWTKQQLNAEFLFTPNKYILTNCDLKPKKHSLFSTTELSMEAESKRKTT